jgi:hypothetical protein
MTTNTRPMAPTAHPFAVFGPAPYRLVGFETTDDREAEQNYRRNSGLSYTTNLCGGSCDLCGTAIWNVYTFEASNGRRFKVGCDCAEKAGEGVEAKAGRRRIERAAVERRQWIARCEREAIERARNLANPAIAEALTDVEVIELHKMIQEFEDAAQRLASRPVGAPKERIKTVAVRFERSFLIETAWGIKRCYKLRTLDGNAITWWTTSGSLGANDEHGYWVPAERGDVLTVAATVKRHTSYNDEEQTEVQRLKVLAFSPVYLPTRASLPY